VKPFAYGAAIVVLWTFVPALSASRTMRIALLIDTSAATTSAMSQIRAGASAFLDALPPEHEVVLVTTGRRTQVRVPPTTDRTKLKGSVDGMLSDNGPTALMDSLAAVDDRFMRKAAERWPVYVIITGDGSENSKEIEEQEFNRWITDISRRGVSANAIVLKSASVGLPDAIVSTLARATRGHYVSIGLPGGIVQAAAQLATQLAADASQQP
jgi:hypothetical protein